MIFRLLPESQFSFCGAVILYVVLKLAYTASFFSVFSTTVGAGLDVEAKVFQAATPAVLGFGPAGVGSKGAAVGFMVVPFVVEVLEVEGVSIVGLSALGLELLT